MPVPKPFDVWRKLTRHRYDASLSLLATNVPNGLPITMTIFPPDSISTRPSTPAATTALLGGVTSRCLKLLGPRAIGLSYK